MPPKRTGTIAWFKDAAGKDYFRGRIRLGDGSREWVDPKTQNMSEARRRERIASWQEQEDKTGLFLARKLGKQKPAGETFEQYAGRWLADRKGRGYETVDTEASMLRTHVYPVVGALPIALMTPDDVERVRDLLDRKTAVGAFKWKTAQNVWGMVTSLFESAHKSKNRALRVLDSNPATGIESTDTGDETSSTYLYPKEFLQLVSCDEVPLRFRRLFCLAVYIYARTGELSALEFGKGIDRVNGIVTIREQSDRRTTERRSTKTGATRSLPIESNLDPLLAVIEAEREGGVGRVSDIKEKSLGLARTLRRALVTAGVMRSALHERTATAKPIDFHALRATGITWSAVRGDSPLIIMQRAGHKSMATTQRYIREAENLRDRIGGVFPALPDAVLVRSKDRADYSRERLKGPKKKPNDGDELPGMRPEDQGQYLSLSRSNLAIYADRYIAADVDNSAIARWSEPRSGHQLVGLAFGLAGIRLTDFDSYMVAIAGTLDPNELP